MTCSLRQPTLRKMALCRAALEPTHHTVVLTFEVCETALSTSLIAPPVLIATVPSAEAQACVVEACSRVDAHHAPVAVRLQAKGAVYQCQVEEDGQQQRACHAAQLAQICMHTLRQCSSLSPQKLVRCFAYPVRRANSTRTVQKQRHLSILHTIVYHCLMHLPMQRPSINRTLLSIVQQRLYEGSTLISTARSSGTRSGSRDWPVWNIGHQPGYRPVPWRSGLWQRGTAEEV